MYVHLVVGGILAQVQLALCLLFQDLDPTRNPSLSSVWTQYPVNKMNKLDAVESPPANDSKMCNLQTWDLQGLTSRLSTCKLKTQISGTSGDYIL